jgi:hypothetical protein
MVYGLGLSLDAIMTPPFWDEAMEHVHDGFAISCWTFGLTLVLEVLSLPTVRNLLSQKGAGPKLYATAILVNLRNHFLLGTPIYAIATTLFCRSNQDLEPLDRLFCILSILWVHAVLFYAAHKAFHTIPGIYRFHRFHHRFNVHVPPMAANAVSTVEYLVAYIVPFTVAMPFVQPDPFSLCISVAIVSFSNLLDHTPFLDAWTQRYMPAWWVTTHDHMEHHRKLNTKYAAPTFNVDYLVQCLDSAMSWSATLREKSSQ